MSPILAAQDAVRGAIVAQAWEWPRSIRSGLENVFDIDEPEGKARRMPLPAIICVAGSSRQVHPNAPSYTVDMTVHVRSQADDTLADDHQSYASQVKEFIEDYHFITWASAGLVDVDFRGAISEAFQITGRVFETTINFEILLNPKQD